MPAMDLAAALLGTTCLTKVLVCCPTAELGGCGLCVLAGGSCIGWLVPCEENVAGTCLGLGGRGWYYGQGERAGRVKRRILIRPACTVPAALHETELQLN